MNNGKRYFINIVSRDKCHIPVDMIDSIMSKDIFLSDVRNKELRIIELGIKEEDIKSYVVLQGGKVYPSTFSAATIARRAYSEEKENN